MEEEQPQPKSTCRVQIIRGKKKGSLCGRTSCVRDPDKCLVHWRQYKDSAYRFTNPDPCPTYPPDDYFSYEGTSGFPPALPILPAGYSTDIHQPPPPFDEAFDDHVIEAGVRADPSVTDLPPIRWDEGMFKQAIAKQLEKSRFLLGPERPIMGNGLASPLTLEPPGTPENPVTEEK